MNGNLVNCYTVDSEGVLSEGIEVKRTRFEPAGCIRIGEDFIDNNGFSQTKSFPMNSKPEKTPLIESGRVFAVFHEHRLVEEYGKSKKIPAPFLTKPNGPIVEKNPDAGIFIFLKLRYRQWKYPQGAILLLPNTKASDSSGVNETLVCIVPEGQIQFTAENGKTFLIRNENCRLKIEGRMSSAPRPASGEDYEATPEEEDISSSIGDQLAAKGILPGGLSEAPATAASSKRSKRAVSKE